MRKLSIPLTKNEVILGIIYLFIQLFVLPVLVVLADVVFQLSLSEVELNFVCFAINFICITAIFHKYLLTSVKAVLEKPISILKIVGIGLLLYFAASYLVGILIMILDPDFSNANDNSIAGMLEQNYALMSLSAVLLAPITEEVLYRGIVFGQIYKRFPIAAFIISSVIFSLLHVVSYIGSYAPFRLLLCFIQYLPPSIVLAWTYVKADNIWAPILIHIVINQIGMLAM